MQETDGFKEAHNSAMTAMKKFTKSVAPNDGK